MNERDETFEKVKFGKEVVELTPNNTSIFRHLGQYALFDHAFVHWPNKDEEKPERWGYIWNENPLFNKIAERAIIQSLTQHLNLPEVSETDYNNWVRHHITDIESVEKRPEWFPEE